MAGQSENQETPKSESSGGHGITRTERLVLLFCFIIALLYAGWQYYQSNAVKVELGEDIPQGMGGIVVQIEGAVESPGVIYLPAGARISDAVEAADGFTSDADTSSVNLTEVLMDGERIIIPFQNDANRNSSGSGQSDVIGLGTRQRIIDEPFSGRTDGSSSPDSSGKVNINTANTYELQTLPGIGEELASRIIQYRQAHTGFDSIEDIMLVEGIGEGKFEDIRNLITVRD